MDTYPGKSDGNKQNHDLKSCDKLVETNAQNDNDKDRLEEQNTNLRNSINEMDSCHSKWRQIGFTYHQDQQESLKEEDEAKANFKALQTAPLSGERILRVLDHALRRLDLLKTFSQIQRVISLINSPEVKIQVDEKLRYLEIICGDEFHNNIQQLAILQSVWRRSKNGDVTGLYGRRGRSTRRWHGPVRDHDDERLIETCSSERRGRVVNPSGMLSPEEQKGEKIDKKPGLVSILKQDPSMRVFLRDLLNLKTQIFTTTNANATNPKATSTLRLIRYALKGRYATHVRKCLKERDLKSLSCILTIVADSEQSTEPDSKPKAQELKSKNDEFNVEEEDPGQRTTDSSGKEDLILTVLDEGDPETLLRSSGSASEIKPAEQLTNLSEMYHTMVDRVDLDPLEFAELVPKFSNRSMVSNWSLATTSQSDSCNVSQGSSNVFLPSTEVSHLALQGISESSDMSKCQRDFIKDLQQTPESEENISTPSTVSIRNESNVNQDIVKYPPILESNLKLFYRKVTEHLIQNPNIMAYFKDIVQKHPVAEGQMDKDESLTSFPSDGFIYFIDLIKDLRDLIRLRFLSSMTEETGKRERIQLILAQLSILSKKLSKLQPILLDIKSSSDTQSIERLNQIQELRGILCKQFENNESSVLEEIKKLEKARMIGANIQGQKREAKCSEMEEWEKRLEYTLETLQTGYKGLRTHRNKLEKEVREVIQEYDTTVSDLQEIVDALSSEEMKNNEIIFRLQSEYKEVEERYEEMRVTKRLRQLLKSLEMAETVKHNWAARRIQDAWRRYKVMKYKKRRFRKGGAAAGGKKKGKESSAKKVVGKATK